MLNSFKNHYKGPGIRGLFAKPLVLTLMFLIVCIPLEARGSEEDNGASEIVNPHNFAVKNYCHFCHKAELPALNFDPVTTCTKCHSGNVDDHPVTRHPIGKPSRIIVPSVLPLTKDGRIVCYTCHDPHNRTGFPRMLRVEYLRLCDSCHTGY